MSDVELRVQKRLTTAFINTQPISVALTPRQKVRTPTGGAKLEELAPRDPQTMRLVEPPKPQLEIALDGIQREVEFLLLGEYDAELGVYDTFSHDGHDWEVVQLYHFNGWERRAAVARLG